MFSEVCTYDRKAKVYILNPPSVPDQYIFPSGAHGKMEAYQFWLSLEYPTVYAKAVALAEANPHAERVIWKAAEIAVTNQVEITGSGEGLVQSSSDPYGRYFVTRNAATDDQLVCNCPAFLEQTPVFISDESGNPLQVCKHALAVWLFSLTAN